jgi:ABC-2 type transport system permease protein
MTTLQHSPTAVSFGATFRSEWIKLTTLRSARRNVVLGVFFGVALTLGVAFITGITFDKWGEDARAEFDPLLFPATGGILTVIFFATVGVNALASEYSSGMIRLTLTATPKRHRVLIAKALSVTLLTTIAGIVVTVGMYGGSHFVYAAYDLPTADFWSGDSARLFVLGALTGCLFPILAMCLTVFTRSTAATLTIVLVTMFLPVIIGGVLPQWWQEHVLVALPGVASDSLVAGHLTETDDHLHPLAAAAISIAWLFGGLGAAIAVFGRRDA